LALQAEGESVVLTSSLLARPGPPAGPAPAEGGPADPLPAAPPLRDHQGRESVPDEGTGLAQVGEVQPVTAGGPAPYSEKEPHVVPVGVGVVVQDEVVLSGLETEVGPAQVAALEV
jgi:hypothetical protein